MPNGGPEMNVVSEGDLRMRYHHLIGNGADISRVNARHPAFPAPGQTHEDFLAFHIQNLLNTSPDNREAYLSALSREQIKDLLGLAEEDFKSRYGF